MFAFDDKEKEGRKAALEKLVQMMSGETGKKLAGLKKPAATEVSIEAEPEDDDLDEDVGSKGLGSMGDDDGDEPSEDDKARIAELYNRYCK